MIKLLVLICFTLLIVTGCDKKPTPASLILRVIRKDYSAGVWTGIYESVRTHKCYLSIHEGTVEVPTEECLP